MRNIYILLISMSVMVACQSKSPQSESDSNGVHGMNAGAIQELSPSNFEQRLKSLSSFYLVDVRTPKEFAEKRINGAVNMDIQDAGFENAVRTLDVTRPVLIYCLSGGRSASAAELFLKAGFKEIYNLEGGLMKWGAEGKALEQGVAGTTQSGMDLETFQSMAASAPLVMIDFNAEWCGPCKKLKPVLEEMEQSGLFKLVSIDVDENPALSEHFKIERIPVMKLYKNGKEVWSHLGFDPTQKETEIRTIEKAISKAKKNK